MVSWPETQKSSCSVLVVISSMVSWWVPHSSSSSSSTMSSVWAIQRNAVLWNIYELLEADCCLTCVTTGVEHRNETDVSGLSQFGITVEVRFVGCLRTGICNFPPLMCAAAKSFLPSSPFSSFTALLQLHLHDPSAVSAGFLTGHCLVCNLFFWQMMFFTRGLAGLHDIKWNSALFLSLSFQISATQRNYLYCVNLVILRRRRKSWRRWRRMIWRWRVLC